MHVPLCVLFIDLSICLFIFFSMLMYVLVNLFASLGVHPSVHKRIYLPICPCRQADTHTHTHSDIHIIYICMSADTYNVYVCVFLSVHVSKLNIRIKWSGTGPNVRYILVTTFYRVKYGKMFQTVWPHRRVCTVSVIYMTYIHRPMWSRSCRIGVPNFQKK